MRLFQVQTLAFPVLELEVDIKVSLLWQDTNPSRVPGLTADFYANSIFMFVVFELLFFTFDGQQLHQYKQREQPPLTSKY